MWRDARDKRLTPLDALKIYALKTSPAFEAAILAAHRLAGPVDAHREAIVRFARHLGVAYQMLNDLDDWQTDDLGAGHRGTDLLGGRPTVLWALALESLSDAAWQSSNNCRGAICRLANGSPARRRSIKRPTSSARWPSWSANITAGRRKRRIRSISSRCGASSTSWPTRSSTGVPSR